tara:strand:+ start:462 stop:620 length:159 start_codon:yes stop_codon:yes gene_type:complete
MIKLTFDETNILLAMIESSSFQGKDIPVMAVIIEKLQKESMKLGQEAVKNGK